MNNYAKRHYEEIAEIFRDELHRLRRERETDPERAVMNVLAEIIILFQNDNTKFDKVRFIKAVIPDEGEL